MTEKDHPQLSFLFVLRIPPHPVLDVVVARPELSRRDEIQLLVREPVVRRQHPVDLIENGLGQGSQNFSLERAPDSCIFALDR